MEGAMHTARMNQLTVYVGLRAEKWADACTDRTLRPEHVMAVTPSRKWVPLNKNVDQAVDRALWGAADELGRPLVDPKTELVVARVDFHAAAVGHWLLGGMLTTQDWQNWRFHGPLPFEVRNENMTLLVEVSQHQIA